MAVSFDGLMEEIEKVMQKCGCGFEEAQYLSSSEWTIGGLKEELLRWKSKLKEINEETKAIRKVIGEAKDFFVKSDKVFKNDAYIIDARYILPGPKSKESLIGEVYLQVDDDFIQPIKDVLLNGEEMGVWFIPNIGEMKKQMSIAIDEKTQYESTLQKVEDESPIRRELQRLQEDTYKDLDDFATIPRQDDPLVFSRKKVFRLEFPGATPLMINIQLLPTIATEEALEEVEFCMKQDMATSGKIPVYYARFRIWFSHFTINIRYKYT